MAEPPKDPQKFRIPDWPRIDIPIPRSRLDIEIRIQHQVRIRIQRLKNPHKQDGKAHRPDEISAVTPYVPYEIPKVHFDINIHLSNDPFRMKTYPTGALSHRCSRIFSQEFALANTIPIRL